jgi:hypothetical protein
MIKEMVDALVQPCPGTDRSKHRPLVMLKVLLSVALATAIAKPALAVDWAPTKPVRIVVPIVGGTNDVVARLVAPSSRRCSASR